MTYYFLENFEEYFLETLVQIESNSPDIYISRAHVVAKKKSSFINMILIANTTRFLGIEWKIKGGKRSSIVIWITMNNTSISFVSTELFLNIIDCLLIWILPNDLNNAPYSFLHNKSKKASRLFKFHVFIFIHNAVYIIFFLSTIAALIALGNWKGLLENLLAFPPVDGNTF